MEDGEESELIYYYQDPLEETLMRRGGQDGIFAPDPDICNPPPPYSDEPLPNDDGYHTHGDHDQHHLMNDSYEDVFSDAPGGENGRHHEPYHDHCSSPE